MNKPSKRWDYLASTYQMDLTALERLPEDTGIALLDRLNKELNEQADDIELIFTEIACNNLDDPRKCAFYKDLHKSTKKKRKKPAVIEEDDDFDPNNPDYLAILEEVKESPRD